MTQTKEEIAAYHREYYKRNKKKKLSSAKVVSKQRYATPGGRATVMLSHARGRAAKKGMPFTLTHEWVKEKIAAGVCEVTGLPFNLNRSKYNAHQAPFAPSLDQIDAGAGYTEDNVQIVCFIHNVARGQWGDDALEIYVRRMHETYEEFA